MPYYREYEGFEVHLDQGEDAFAEVVWSVQGYGREHVKGTASTRQEAFLAARDVIDAIKAGPNQYPINLVGYSDQSEGDFLTREGEYLGRWAMLADDSLEIIGFTPDGKSEVLFRNHFIGTLCADIRDWHRNTAKP